MEEMLFCCAACGREFAPEPMAVLESYSEENDFKEPVGGIVVCLDCQSIWLNDNNEKMH